MQRRVLLIACAMLLSLSSPRADDSVDGDEESQIPNCGSVQGNTVNRVPVTQSLGNSTSVHHSRRLALLRTHEFGGFERQR